VCFVWCKHSVGARHDGLGNECSSTDQYVMARGPSVLTDSNFNNPFRFSQCSIRSFWQYLYTLEVSVCTIWI